MCSFCCVSNGSILFATKYLSIMKTQLSAKFLQFLLLPLFVFVLNVGWGQTTVFWYQNTTATIPTSWVLTNNITSNTVDRSTYLLLESGNPSDIITTPNYDMLGYSNVTFAYSVATFGTVTSNPAMKVQVSTDGGSSWSSTTYTSSTVASSTYVNGTLSITGQTFTTTTKFRISNTLTTGAGLRLQNLKLTGTLTPTITSSSTLSATNTTYGTASASPTSFNVSGANMSAGILVTPPAGYEVSLSSGSGYASTVTVGSSGTIASTAVYVRLAATTAVGAYSGNIVLSSTSATSVNVATASSSVSPKALTVQASNQTKTEGTTSPTTGTLNTHFTVAGLVNGNIANQATLVYSGSTAGNLATATPGSYTITPSALTLSSGNTSNYSITYNTGTLTINAASTPTLNPVTLTTTLSSTYGTASTGVSFTANGSNLTAENITATAQSGYEVSTALGSGYVASVSVAAGTTVYVRFTSAMSAGDKNNATAVVLTGGGASSGANVTTSSSGNTVSQKALTVTGLTAQNKVYDGLTSATVSGTAAVVAGGVVNSDVVSLSGSGSFTFSSAAVGAGVAITTTGYSLTGTNASNYTLTQPSFSADITVRSLTITASNVSKYAGVALTGGAGSTAFTSSGLQNSETIASVSIAYGTAGDATGDGNTVGVYASQVTPSAATGGTFTASNYSISYVAGSITVTAAPVTLASWNFFAESSPTTSTADVSNANLSSAPVLSRGAGAASSSGSNSFRTVGFQNNGIATSNTDYFQASINSTNGVVSLSTLDAKVVGTASYCVAPGVSQQFAYSLDGTNFTLIGSAQGTIGTPGTLTQMDLSNISALQNVPANTTITLRYYASGQTTTGGWGFSSASVSSSDDGFTIKGSVKTAPILSTPTSASLTTTSATLGATISSDGGASVTARGTVWGTAAAPTGNSLAASGTTVDAFSHSRTDLTANTLYYYRGYATNSVGTGYSVDGTFTTLPLAPSVGSGSSATASGFTANWSHPTMGSASYTYTVEVDDNNAFGSINATVSSIASSNTSAAITGLAAGTTYYYRVKAVNASGSSSWSSASVGYATLSTDATLSALSLSSGTLNPVFASATTTYTASVTNATTSITVTPTLNQANATIQVRVNGGNYSSVTSGNASGSLALNVNDNTVDVLVTAQDGTIKTYTITVTRAATTPSAPTITAITPGNALLSVEFDAPEANGGASITNYEYSTNNGGSYTAFSPVQITTPLVISGLTNETTYDVQIRAVNSAGSGAASNMIQGTPVAPVDPTITVAPALFASSFSTTYGTASAVQSFTVAAAAIDEDITVTAPTGLEISLSNNTGFGSSLILAQSSGEVASTTIYARLSATASFGNYNSIAISAAGGGAPEGSISTSSSGNAVSAKALTITGLSVANKSYDGTATATVSGTSAYSGLANSETFAIVGSATATFASANVGNGIAVSVTGFLAPSSNYSITQPSLAANITAVNLTISGIAVSNKTYNGLATATITGTAVYQGLVNNESFAITGTPTAVFTSVNVGTSISVTVSGYTAPSANYTISQPTGLTADITQATQTISFTSFTTPITASTTIVASSNFGSAISYSSSNSNVATINSSTGVVAIVGNGTTTITASNSGNSNYSAASVSQVLTVNSPSTSLIAFDFAGIAGDEATAGSTSISSGIASSTISRGSGLLASSNTDRFNATNWATGSIANAASGNDYMEFTITPNSGFQFSVSSILFQIQRSGTGLTGIALRSSLDNYSSNLDAEKSVVDNTSTQSFTFTFSQSNSSSAVTYRLYGYSEAATGSAGPGDGTGNDIVVNGSVSCITPSQSSSITGPSTVCSGTSQTYSVTNVAGVGYNWSLPNGWSGTSTTNSISSPAGTSGTISVTPYNSASGCTNYTATSQSVSVTVNPAPTAPTAGNASRCGTGTVGVSATAGAGETIDWYSSATGGTLLLSGNSSYTTPSISSTTIYYAEARNTTTGCVSATRTAATVTINTLPSAPTASSTSRCGEGAVTITASANAGETTDWFAASSGGSALAQTTGTFTTPTLISTTTYYVEARNTTTGCVSTNRTEAIVTIITPAVPSITIASSDANNSICPNEPVTFTATDTNGGTAPTYQWKLNGSDVSGEGSTYTNSTLLNNDIVSVVMTANNSCQSANTATSEGITTVVNTTPAALSITGSTYCSHTNALPNTTYGSITSSNSLAGISYTLFNVNGDEVYTYAGTGSALVWTGVVANSGYYVTGENTSTGCVGNASTATAVIQTTATIPLYTDTDGDNFGTGAASGWACTASAPAGYSLNTGDCDNTNSAIKPTAVEICGNNIDENCSGASDDAPIAYRSIADGNWGDASTWEMTCNAGSAYVSATYAPLNYFTGITSIQNTHDVIIPANGVTYQTGTLEIVSGGSLTLNGNGFIDLPTSNNISPIAKLTVTQSINNSGTLTIGHQASLAQSSTTAVNTGSGTVSIETKLTGSNNGTAPNGRYWYIGSPMNNTSAGQFFDVQNMVRLWSYNGSNNSWGVVVHSTSNPTVTTTNKLVPGIGYLYRGGANKTITYVGTAAANLNNNITSNLLNPTLDGTLVNVLGYQSTGYKFVANPYPSHIDWRLVTRSGLNVSYWIRNANNSAYDAYNATTNVSTGLSGQTTRFIPPMQGFYVFAFNSTPSLRIDNTDRVHSSNVLHAPTVNQVVRLRLNNGESSDYTVVYENEVAANDYEEADTDKMFDYDFHQLYTLEGEHELSLNGLLNATSKGSVDMGIAVPNNGAYTIEATDLEVEEEVILEDKFTNTFQDLKVNPIYSFTSNAGTFNERFVLHFTTTETVGVGETVVELEGVNVFTTTGQQVKVWVTNTAEFQNATVKVYDAIGNLVERKNMTSNELLLDLNTATGVYLMEVTGDSKVFTKKIFISK